MKKYIIIISIILLLPSVAWAADLRGRLVVGPFDGKAWYIRPDNKKVTLGGPDFAYFRLKTVAETMTDKDLAVIAKSATSTLAVKSKGKIISKQSDSSLWYVNPSDNKLISFSSPLALNLFIIKNAVRPTGHDFAKIHKPGMDESIDQYSYYKSQTMLVDNKKMKVDVMMVDLAMPSLVVSTLAANKKECPKNCPAKNVADFVSRVNGFAAINGTYFDTAANKKNYSFFPLFDTQTGVLLNKDYLKKWTNGPIVAFDEQNRFYYFKDSRYFLPALTFNENSVTVTQGEKTGTLKAALGSFPRLVEDYNDFLIGWAMDNKQRDVKAERVALGYKDNKIFIIVTQNSTVSDLTAVCMTMGMQYAFNLDGGYSTALFYNSEYMLGPGRDVVNALVFSVKQ